jgi:hypothetical protein
MSEVVVSLGFMKRTRLPIPAGLADLPPGPELAAALATIEPRRLGGLDCVEVMRAQHRQASHEQARLMTTMVEVALCGIGPDDELPRMDAPDEFSADEIRGALAWTRSAASTQLALAWDLIDRLPEVFAALEAGAIDVPKTKIFSEWTTGLTGEQARQVCDAVLPEAPTLTTGQLTERIKRLAIAIDPDWARRRYEEAVRGRKVVGYRNEDGTANLCGYQLPAERAAAACAHIDGLAKSAKRAGDARSLDNIKADLYMGMLDGTYTGWPAADIIAHILTTADEHGAGEAQPRPFGDPRHSDEHGDEQADNQRPDDQHTDNIGPAGSLVPPASHARPRRAGVEIRAELTTLLGLDDHPGEMAGWGYVDAKLARRLVREQTAAEWRYAITDDTGRLLHEGVTRCRPVGYPDRAAAPCRGGIVELQISIAALHRLAARQARLGCWAKVIADLARQADQHQQADQHGQRDRHGQEGPPKDGLGHDGGGRRRDFGAPRDRSRPSGDDARGPRSPGKPMRRRTEIRDRTCVHPRCRTPARRTDGDHTEDWARGGATKDDNLGSVCCHDHRLKHEGGWTVTQPLPGHFQWMSRLGRPYYVRPRLIMPPLPDPIPRDPPPPF